MSTWESPARVGATFPDELGCVRDPHAADGDPLGATARATAMRAVEEART